jgi:hypothetical protein
MQNNMVFQKEIEDVLEERRLLNGGGIFMQTQN